MPYKYFAIELSVLTLEELLFLYSPRVCLLFHASAYSFFVACKVEPRSGVKARTLLLQVENQRTLETTTSPRTPKHQKTTPTLLLTAFAIENAVAMGLPQSQRIHRRGVGAKDVESQVSCMHDELDMADLG